MRGQNLVNADVACEKLGITREKLVKLAKSGKIASMRLPFGRLYDIEEYISRGGCPEYAPKIKYSTRFKHYLRVTALVLGFVVLVVSGFIFNKKEAVVEASVPLPIKKPEVIKKSEVIKKPKVIKKSEPKTQSMHKSTPKNKKREWGGFWPEHY